MQKANIRIEQLMLQMKNGVQPEKLTQIKTLAKQAKINHLNLWSLRSQTKILFKMARAQSYVLLFAGVFVFPYTMYQKYQEDNSKLQIIPIITPFALAILLTPMYLYRKHTQSLLSSIKYNFEGNSFEFTKFRKNKIIEVPINQIHVQLTKKGRIKSITNNALKEKSQIEGLGQWHNIHIFKHLVEKEQL